MHEIEIERSSKRLGTQTKPSAMAGQFLEADPEKQFIHRVSFITRRGEFLSYPYSQISAIYAPTPGEIIINCCCTTYARICISGRDLGKLAMGLHAQKIIAVEESEALRSMLEGSVVRTITFHERENRRS